MRIRYVAVGGRSGYAEFGRYFVSALHEAGHDVACLMVGVERAPVEGLGPKGALVESLCREMPDAEVNIINTPPTGSYVRHRIPGALNLGFTMFETTRISSDWVDSCNQMDGILVPSTFCKKTFVDSGVKVPVHVVYPGVDPAAVPSERTVNLNPFQFLSIFQWSDRKDPIALLTAYWQEFRASERVSLTLKTYPFGRLVNIPDAIAAIKASLRFREFAPVEVISEMMSTEALWRLHSSADCFVSAHHSEGWGMSLVDAMASGTPTIATDYSANLDYMTPENSYLVPCSIGPATFTQTELRPFYDSSTMQWGSVYVDELRARMRHVFEHREEARVVGLRARADILSKFNPDNSAKMIEAAIRATPKIVRRHYQRIGQRPRRAAL